MRGVGFISYLGHHYTPIINLILPLEVIVLSPFFISYLKLIISTILNAATLPESTYYQVCNSPSKDNGDNPWVWRENAHGRAPVGWSSYGFFWSF